MTNTSSSRKTAGLRVRACILVCGLAIALAAPGACAQVQDYPSKPIRIIGGLAVGGPADLATRIVAQALGAKLGQSIIVENRIGGGGAIAIQEVGRAPKDGYVLGAPTTGPLTILPRLLKTPFYETLDIVTPIALIASYPYVLVVRKEFPVSNVAELLDHARRNPGKLSYGSGGNGTSNHIGMEWLKRITGIDILHVPYKGDNDIISDLIGGRIDLAMNTPAVILGHINSGRVKALAVASPGRLPALGQVPTMVESGVRDFFLEAYTMIVGPAGMPRDVAARLNREINEVLQTADVKEKLARSTMYPVIHSPESIRKFVEDQQALWGTVIRDANIPQQ